MVVTHSAVPGAKLKVRTPDAAIGPAGDGTLTVTCYMIGLVLVGRRGQEEPA